MALGGVAAVATQDVFIPSEARVDKNVGRPAPDYPRNSAGLTYGSAAKAVSPETEPDLISAVGDDGVSGYVYAADLDYQPDFKSPQEAVEWQNANAGKHVKINLYEVDGKTKIGQFTITPPTPEELDAGNRAAR